MVKHCCCCTWSLRAISPTTSISIEAKRFITADNIMFVLPARSRYTNGGCVTTSCMVHIIHTPSGARVLVVRNGEKSGPLTYSRVTTVRKYECKIYIIKMRFCELRTIVQLYTKGDLNSAWRGFIAIAWHKFNMIIFKSPRWLTDLQRIRSIPLFFLRMVLFVSNPTYI